MISLCWNELQKVRLPPRWRVTFFLAISMTSFPRFKTKKVFECLECSYLSHSKRGVFTIYDAGRFFSIFQFVWHRRAITSWNLASSKWLAPSSTYFPTVWYVCAEMLFVKHRNMAPFAATAGSWWRYSKYRNLTKNTKDVVNSEYFQHATVY